MLYSWEATWFTINLFISVILMLKSKLIHYFRSQDIISSPKMKRYCRIACCLLLLFFLSPQNSTFTSLSQASFYPLLSQQCFNIEKTALLQLKRDLSAAIPESTVRVSPLDSLMEASHCLLHLGRCYLPWSHSTCDWPLTSEVTAFLILLIRVTSLTSPTLKD